MLHTINLCHKSYNDDAASMQLLDRPSWTRYKNINKHLQAILKILDKILETPAICFEMFKKTSRHSSHSNAAWSPTTHLNNTNRADRKCWKWLCRLIAESEFSWILPNTFINNKMRKKTDDRACECKYSWHAHTSASVCSELIFIHFKVKFWT